MGAGAEEYVLVWGGVLPGRAGVRMDDFEMQARPVTNGEYGAFVRESGRGRVPPT